MSEKESNGYTPRHSLENAETVAQEEAVKEDMIETAEAADTEQKLNVSEVEIKGVRAPSFDYIVPEESYREHQKKRRKRRRKKKKEKAQSAKSGSESGSEDESTEGYVFPTASSGHHHHH
ncbi:MAG: hypothetical protein IJI50_06790, partial [Ruminococcus sp.]|nr:hypothetical protein [Ruminococcus sp.]